MALRARQEAGLDVKGEEPLVIARSVDALSSPLFRELPRERQPEVRVVDRLGSPCQVETGHDPDHDAQDAPMASPRGPQQQPYGQGRIGASYSSWRRNQLSGSSGPRPSFRPCGARSSHWYMPQRPSRPRA